MSAPSTLLASTEPLARAYDVALLDLDGVVYRGPAPVEHASEAVAVARAGGMRMSFVTNNASREPAEIARQLTGLGMPAAAEDVMTSALAAAAMLADELPAGSGVLAVGAPALRTALVAAGFRLVTGVEERPAAVVQGFSPDLSWRDLAQAAYAVQAGARHVATNLDTTLPTEHGIAPGNGSLVGAVRNATGQVPASAGKPQPAIFHQAVRRAGAQAPLAVGDRLDTDLAGARAAGIPGLHVLTGVSDARAVVLARAEERPSFLATDLRGLLEPHPAPTRASDGWWRCGSRAARVRVHDGEARLELDDGALGAGVVRVDVDAWRALACAAWAAADDGAPVAPGAVPVLEVPAGA
ncbi:HAD-IIA family hydrolase [Georgenia sp. MJ206]|uniref:HAD-IIA family hydrolase n=1 Tax=Georgenia wangjunii TaxID=3117730 RepID=UPI002F26DC35